MASAACTAAWICSWMAIDKSGGGSPPELPAAVEVDGVVVTRVGLELDITDATADVGLDYLEVIASSVSVVELCYCACVMRTVTRYTERPLRDLPATSQLRLTTVKVAL